MASRTAVSALPWHHSMLDVDVDVDVDARAGLAGATLGLGAENRRSALTFRYSGMRNRRYCTSIFHDDDDARPRLPAAKSGGGLAAAFLLPATPLRPLEAGVLWAERYSGDEGGGDRGALLGRSATAGSLGRRRPLRMTWLALTSTGDGGSLLPPPPGKPNSKSLSVAVVFVVHRMEKSSAGSMSMKDLELPKELPRSASARRSNDGAGAPLLSHPREKLSPRCCSEATSMSERRAARCRSTAVGGDVVSSGRALRRGHRAGTASRQAQIDIGASPSLWAGRNVHVAPLAPFGVIFILSRFSLSLS